MEKMVNCKYCQSEISKKAKICPVCKKRQKKRGLAIVLIIIGVIGMISVMSSMMDDGTEPGTKTESTKAESSQKEYATLEEFNQIEMGMTYEEVCKIIGCEGSLTSESSVMDVTMAIYTWYGKDGISNMNVTFQNGEAMAKAQMLME